VCAVLVTVLSVTRLYPPSRRRRRRGSNAGESAVGDAAGQPASVGVTRKLRDQRLASVFGSIARPVRRPRAPVRPRRRGGTPTGGSARRAPRIRITRRLHVPTRPVRNAHAPSPVTAVSTNLYLEAEPRDRSLGTVRGFAMAFACRQNGGGPERYFLVEDPSKPAPVWVSETEVRLEYRGDLNRYGMPPAWDDVTTPRASHAAELGTAETVT
jgi:hypothetical protein